LEAIEVLSLFFVFEGDLLSFGFFVFSGLLFGFSSGLLFGFF